MLPTTKGKLVAPGRTFRQASEDYMAEKLKRLRNAVHRRQWRYSLETFAYPVIGDLDVSRRAFDLPVATGTDNVRSNSPNRRSRRCTLTPSS